MSEEKWKHLSVESARKLNNELVSDLESMINLKPNTVEKSLVRHNEIWLIVRLLKTFNEYWYW